MNEDVMKTKDAKPVEAVGSVTDQQIIATCNAAGVRWIPEGEDDFPGMFDLTKMSEMRALFAALAHPRPTGDVAGIPILGWAWLLVDERTGRDYDSGFVFGENKPEIPARSGTHYDYRAVIARHKALEATGELNAHVRVSRNILHGPNSDAVVADMDGEEPTGSLVPEVSIRGARLSGHEGLTAPTVEQAGEVVASDWRHIANEWSDIATNAFQWLKNIQRGISTADEAMENMQQCLAYGMSLAAAPAPAKAGE